MLQQEQRFNPQRAPQAIQPAQLALAPPERLKFQSPTGSPGHSAEQGKIDQPRLRDEFQSPTGSPGHSAARRARKEDTWMYVSSGMTLRVSEEYENEFALLAHLVPETISPSAHVR